MTTTDIKDELIEFCKSSCILIFKENIERFTEICSCKTADLDDKKNYEEEDYIPFSYKTFDLRINDILDEYQSMKTNFHYRNSKMKESIKISHITIQMRLSSLNSSLFYTYHSRNHVLIGNDQVIY